jgi:hypothetical protein
MKIMSQSADELVLKEGNASGMAIGGGLIVAGALAGYYRHASGPMGVWIALALVAAGVGLILFSSSISVNANRASGQLFYQKKRLIGARSRTYRTADILRIETRKQWRTENTANAGNRPDVSTPQQLLVAQSVIVFKDGREVPLDHQKTSSSMSVGSVVLMGGQGAEVAMAVQVANFLGVPFQEIAPPSFGGMQINLR